jgi:lycopene cyclase domain-containing protein
MPEYTGLALVALALAAGAALAVGLHRDRAAWLTVAVFAACTLVFDLVLTALPIVTYDPHAISGIGIGPMPIEDLAYGVALCLTALVGWTLAGRSRGLS